MAMVSRRAQCADGSARNSLALSFSSSFRVFGRRMPATLNWKRETPGRHAVPDVRMRRGGGGIYAGHGVCAILIKYISN